MKKPRRRVPKNWALRNELINKGIITPVAMVPSRLKARGFVVAAEAAAMRLKRGRPLYVR